MTKQTSIAIVGLGKIAQDQHVPTLRAHSDFNLVATVSRSASLHGIANYSSLDELLAAQQVDAVALCLPPQPRFDIAMRALQAGKHVLLEKPPGVTVKQVQDLQQMSETHGVVLYASWHSRHAPAVPAAKRILAGRTIQSVRIDWCEDVEKWHPGQDWIWQPGGMGVFDPGINALSILTELLGETITVTNAKLVNPIGKAMPITAYLQMISEHRVPITALFDWQPIDDEVWQIVLQTDRGDVALSKGGAVLFADGDAVELPETTEYRGVYDRFSALLRTGVSDADARPLLLVEQAFAKN